MVSEGNSNESHGKDMGKYQCHKMCRGENFTKEVLNSDVN